MLMAANLLGFVTGLDGLPDFLRALVQDKTFLCAVVITFFSAAQVPSALPTLLGIALGVRACVCFVPLCIAGGNLNGRALESGA